MVTVMFLEIATVEGLLSMLAKAKIKTICDCAIITCSIIAAFYLFYHLHQVEVVLNGANWFWILVQRSWTKGKIIKVIKGFVMLLSMVMVLVIMPCCIFDEN